MKVNLAEEPYKIDAVVRDEREFILDDSLRQFPVRFATQAKMVDVGCFESGLICGAGSHQGAPAEGLEFDRIAARMNEERIPSRTGKPWHGVVVNRILTGKR